MDPLSLKLLHEAISTGWHAYSFARGGTLYRLFDEVASQHGRAAALAIHDAWLNSDLPRDQLNQAESLLRGAYQSYSEQAEPGAVKRWMFDTRPAYMPNPMHKALLNAAATALLAAEVTHYSGNPPMSRTWRERADSMYRRYRQLAHPSVDPAMKTLKGSLAGKGTYKELCRRYDQNCREFEAAYRAAVAD